MPITQCGEQESGRGTQPTWLVNGDTSLNWGSTVGRQMLEESGRRCGEYASGGGCGLEVGTGVYIYGRLNPPGSATYLSSNYESMGYWVQGTTWTIHLAQPVTKLIGTGRVKNATANNTFEDARPLNSSSRLPRHPWTSVELQMQQ